MFGIIVMVYSSLLNKILPPINNIYCATINIPIVGKQSIIYRRTEDLKATLLLTGKVNMEGYIYFNIYNTDAYILDRTLQNLLKKYKCSVSNTLYNHEKDIILIDLKLNLIKYTKQITLMNINVDVFPY
tara:strand:+ start:7623 stop:8009 length:387 start_codon:yes stop_codon:yes gene_type:complete